ncbi:uncharacterized protein CTRU02_205586, partial [Colletotrichum truncatum]
AFPTSFCHIVTPLWVCHQAQQIFRDRHQSGYGGEMTKRRAAESQETQRIARRFICGPQSIVWLQTIGALSLGAPFGSFGLVRAKELMATMIARLWPWPARLTDNQRCSGGMIWSQMCLIAG